MEVNESKLASMEVGGSVYGSRFTSVEVVGITSTYISMEVN